MNDVEVTLPKTAIIGLAAHHLNEKIRDCCVAPDRSFVLVNHPERLDNLPSSANLDLVIFHPIGDPRSVFGTIQQLHTRGVPSIIILPPGSTWTQSMALEYGTFSVIGYPLDPTILRAVVRSALRHRAEIVARDVSHATDDLSGFLLNTAYMQRAANRFAEKMYDHHPLGLVFFALRNIRRVNDVLGTHEADWIITVAAKTARSLLGKDAIVGRLHGVNFSGIIPCPNVANLQKIVLNLAEWSYTVTSHLRHSEHIPVAMNVGGAFIDPRTLGRRDFPTSFELAKVTITSSFRQQNAGPCVLDLFAQENAADCAVAAHRSTESES